jgi:8-oxo-dGTP pyrophosphatase MutT (NUDIX family)
VNIWVVDDLAHRTGVAPKETVRLGPSGPEQTAMLQLLSTHPDALVRTCRPGHFTGSALVVDPENQKILMLFHTKLQRWLQPGGHADGDGDLARVALREATEETGIEGLRVVEPAIDFDVHTVNPPSEDQHQHHDVRFLVLAPPGAVPQGNHESQALQWVSQTEMSDLGVDPGTMRMVQRGLTLLKEL